MGDLAVAVSEGLCPNGHGRLEVVRLHGHDTGTCRACGCSWRISGGQVHASACVPGDHSCGAVT